MNQTLYCTVLLYYCKVWRDEGVWKCKFGCLELSSGISLELGLEKGLAIIFDATCKYFPKNGFLRKNWESKKEVENVAQVFLGYSHQSAILSLQPQHTCHVHFHLHILNKNCHLQLLVSPSPYMPGILE